MGEMSKSQVIQSLYTIRAGLAQVSQRSTRTTKLREERQERVNQRKKTAKELYDLELKYKEYKQYLENSPSEEALLNKGLEQKEKIQKEENRENKKRNVMKAIGLLLVGGAIVVAIVGFLVYAYLYSSVPEDTPEAESMIIEVLKFLGCCVVVFFAGTPFLAFADMNHDSDKLYALKKENKQITDEMSKVGKMKTHITKTEHLRSLLAAPEDYSAIDTEVKAKTEEGVVIYGALENAYSSLLDTRDWGNIDLLIYYLETNRADNIKEALLLVDTERRHTELMTLMTIATKEICSRINAWGSRMSFQLDNIAANQQNLIAGIGNVNANLRDLLSATNLQNALLEKQNVTSQQLMQDVEALRSHSDYLRYKNARF